MTVRWSVLFVTVVTLAMNGSAPATTRVEWHSALTHYLPPPTSNDSWFWEIDPPVAGVRGLPPVTAAYPAPGSAHIWDTDLFDDSNTSAGQVLRVPTGPSPVVRALHAAGHYSICYIEAVVGKP